MDIRYRRIPNKLVLLILLGGLTLNTIFGGSHGLLVSLGGFGLAFALMFFFHVFGTMGAGDVKLFAAIGAVMGLSLVLPTLLVVGLTGGVLAIGKMIYARRVAHNHVWSISVFLWPAARTNCAALRYTGRPQLHVALRRAYLLRQFDFVFSISRLRPCPQALTNVGNGELSHAK